MQATRQSRLLERVVNHSPDYVSFLLVILCGFLLARLLWMFFPAQAPVTRLDAPPPAIDATEVMQDLGAKIADLHLFGEQAAKTAAAPAEPIQNTQLALKLQGVYALPDKRGYAVIEEGGEQKAYAIGKTIGNSGAVLEEIFSTHVTLRRNDKLEKLELPKIEQTGGNSAGGVIPDAPPMMDIPPTVEVPVMDGQPGMPPPEAEEPPVPDGQPVVDPGIVPPPPAPPSSDAANLGEFRQAVLNNNMRLLEVASPQPHEVDGKFAGFRLMPGSNTALFNQLGLQPGDIVTTVNGSVLDSPAAGMQALQGAASASQVTLGITRGGQQITLPLSF